MAEKEEERDPLSEHMRKFVNSNVPIVKKDQTLKDVVSLLRSKKTAFDIIDYVYVVDKDHRLVGAFSLKDVFSLPESTLVDKVMQTSIVSASPKTHLDAVANLALRHGIKSVPVVHDGKLLGVISSKNILHILNRSLRRDIFHFAGIHKSHLEYENTLTVPFFESIMHRTPWLLVGLVGIILTAGFISLFSEVLEKNLVLAFFIPAIVYMSGALGNQVQTLFVRDLAIMGRDLNASVYLLRQMFISALIALIISVVMYSVVSFFWNDSHVAFVIGLAAFASIIITSFTAFAITFVISRLGQDPALGGGPFATVVSDATSIIVYFALASILL